MKIKTGSLRQRFATISALALIFQVLMPWAGSAQAASLSSTTLRLDRLQASSPTTARLVFTTSATNGTTVGKVVVTFPAGFTISTTQATSVVTCPGESGAAALPGTLTAAGAGQVITISGVTGAANSTAYCVDLTTAAAVTNNVTPGAYSMDVATQTSGAVGLDSTIVTEFIIGNDQVTISATVNPSFTFTLSGNSDTIPAFASGTRSLSTGVTATVATNASKGWIAWVRDSSSGLVSAAAGTTIATTGVGSASHVVNASANDYVLSAIKTAQTGASLTPDANYASDGTDYKGGGLDNTKLRPVASETGPCTGDVITLKTLASVASTTAAANDYTDTLTIVGAGQF